MKKYVLLSVGLILLGMLSIYQGVKAQSVTAKTNRYESGLFVCQPSDYIRVDIENLGSASHTYTVIVFGTITSASFTQVLNTGSTSISGSTGTKAEYFLPSTASANSYGVEVTTDSDSVVVGVSVFPVLSGGGYATPRYWLYGSQLAKFESHF